MRAGLLYRISRLIAVTVCLTAIYPLASFGDSQGPFTPSAVIDAGGNHPWMRPLAAAVSDNHYALTMPATGPVNTDALEATRFGFAIPAGSRIDGLEIFVVGYSLLQDARLTGNTKKRGVSSPSPQTMIFKSNERGQRQATNHTHVLGDATALFGDTWTADDINDVGFGVEISISAATSSSLSIDGISVTVHYTPPDETETARLDPAVPEEGGKVAGVGVFIESRLLRMGIKLEFRLAPPIGLIFDAHAFNSGDQSEAKMESEEDESVNLAGLATSILRGGAYLISP